jgi:hypothetical protein
MTADHPGRCLLAAALVLLGCAKSPGHDPSDTATAAAPLTAATVPLAGGCAADDHGGFVVLSAGADSGVSGSVADGVVPAHVLEEVAAEGDCRMMRRNNPFCDPACEPGQTCDFDGVCVPFPTNQDLGTVQLDGLVAPVEMEPVFPGYTYFDTSLSEPPFVGGSLIMLQMPGGTHGPLTLHGVGVEPLVTEEAWSVEAGVDLVVRWDAPSGTVSRGEVALHLHIDQHGNSPASLVCVFDDDGEGTVPAGLLQTLVDTGVTGFPSGVLERRTRDHAELSPGCMDFAVSSSVSIAVDIVGHTPCINKEDCPDGMTCDEILQVCE